MTEEELSPGELVARYLVRHDWRRTRVGEEPPKERLASVWEDWIEQDPERAWPIFLEFVRVRPSDVEILEMVWRRMRYLLSRHGRRFHTRVIELVASNALLSRIAPPFELTLEAYRPKPLDIDEVAQAYIANAMAHEDAHELEHLVSDDPRTAVALTLEIIERGPSHGFTSYDTHPPLEDLLASDGPDVVDVIETAAERSVLVRRCLWWMSRGRNDSMSKAAMIAAPVYDRLEAVRAGATDYNTDDVPGSPKTLSPEYERVVEGWFAYEKNFWAWERAHDLVRNDPDPAWHLIERLVANAPNDDVLGSIAAGPLEDFIREHGVHFIDRIERWAERDERFRHCLRGVWQTDTPDEIWARIEAARDRTESDDTL